MPESYTEDTRLASISNIWFPWAPAVVIFATTATPLTEKAPVAPSKFTGYATFSKPVPTKPVMFGKPPFLVLDANYRLQHRWLHRVAAAVN